MNMWTKEFASKMGRMVVRGLVRWLEMMGENPPLSRDHGFLVWQVLHQAQDEAGRSLGHELDGGRPGQPGRDAAPIGWVPPLGSIEPKTGPAHRAI
jgi:hypothetical protein